MCTIQQLPTSNYTRVVSFWCTLSTCAYLEPSRTGQLTANWTSFKEETSEVLHTNYSFVWCWNLGTRKVDQKYLERFEMWYWRRMDKISWTDHVRNNKVSQRVKEEKNMLQTIRIRKANWIGQILCRNCLLKHILEGKIAGRNKVIGRRQRCKQLLDDLKEKTWYCKSKQEELGRILWRTCFGPVASHKRTNYYYLQCTPYVTFTWEPVTKYVVLAPQHVATLTSRLSAADPVDIEL